MDPMLFIPELTMLLTVAVALLLICTVFVLPVLLSVAVGGRSPVASGGSAQT